MEESKPQRPRGGSHNQGHNQGHNQSSGRDRTESARLPNGPGVDWDSDALLDARTEAQLVERWCRDRDQAAANRLVRSYHRLVVKIARRYRGLDVPLPDLVAEGYVGLIKAMERFDPSRGFRLSTYAVWWIRSAISDAAVNGSLVRAATGETGRKLFFNLRRVKWKLGAGEGELPPETAAAIARELGVDQAEVVQMDRWFSSKHVSISSRLDKSSEKSRELEDVLADPTQDNEAQVIRRDERQKQRALVHEALATLSDRERKVLEERWLRDEPRTLADLGARMGITRERVRQIEVAALDKLRKRTREAARAMGMSSDSGPLTIPSRAGRPPKRPAPRRRRGAAEIAGATADPAAEAGERSDGS